MSLNEFDLHEALDRTSNIIDIIESQLVSHKAIKKNKKHKKLVKKVQARLAELYQQLGAELHSNEDNTPILFVDELAMAAPGVKDAAIEIATDRTEQTKSDVVAQFAADNGLPVIDIKVSTESLDINSPLDNPPQTV